MAYEYRIVLTRNGRHPIRHGGSSYPRCTAANEAQAIRFVEQEEREGHRAWIERREITPWEKYEPGDKS